MFRKNVESSLFLRCVELSGPQNFKRGMTRKKISLVNIEESVLNQDNEVAPGVCVLVSGFGKKHLLNVVKLKTVLTGIEDSVSFHHVNAVAGY